MAFKRYTVTIEVRLTDPRAAIKAARADAYANAIPLRRDFTARDAVQWLVDPGTRLTDAGIEVEESSVS